MTRVRRCWISLDWPGWQGFSDEAPDLSPLPLAGVNRTFKARPRMSAKCKKATLAVPQIAPQCGTSRCRRGAVHSINNRSGGRSRPAARSALMDHSCGVSSASFGNSTAKCRARCRRLPILRATSQRSAFLPEYRLSSSRLVPTARNSAVPPASTGVSIHNRTEADNYLIAHFFDLVEIEVQCIGNLVYDF